MVVVDFVIQQGMPSSGEELVAVLLRRFPEFEQRLDASVVDMSLATLVFGEFAQFLAEEARKPSADVKLLTRAFEFLDQLLEGGSPLARDCVTTGCLEVLFDDPDVRKSALTYMSPSLRAVSREIIRFWWG